MGKLRSIRFINMVAIRQSSYLMLLLIVNYWGVSDPNASLLIVNVVTRSHHKWPLLNDVTLLLFFVNFYVIKQLPQHQSNFYFYILLSVLALCVVSLSMSTHPSIPTLDSRTPEQPQTRLWVKGTFLPDGGTRWDVKRSPKSLRVIFEGLWISRQNPTAIWLIVVEIFCPGLRCWMGRYCHPLVLLWRKLFLTCFFNLCLEKVRKRTC